MCYYDPTLFSQKDQGEYQKPKTKIYANSNFIDIGSQYVPKK